MKKNWTEVKTSLKDVNRQGLLGLISDLYKLSSENKIFLHTRFSRSKENLQQYKEDLIKYLSPKNYKPWSGQKIQFAKARQVLSNYNKALGDPKGSLDLMIFYCQTGMRFLIRYDTEEISQYENSIMSIIKSMTKHIERYPEIREDFKNELDDIFKMMRRLEGEYGLFDHVDTP
ncbi:MAG: hypothetical protein HRU43_00475 [Simkaniaceae bacterium]|nr:hypothetical protein [Simkaniaceae bacterium]